MKANESVKNYDSKIREYVNYSYRQAKNSCKESTGRDAGSENESEMQKHFVSELEVCTDEVTSTDFSFHKTSAFSENICNVIVFIIAVALAITTTLGLFKDNTFATVVSVIAILAGIANIFSGITSKIFAKKSKSANVFAVKKAKVKAEKRLILLSNSDSVRYPKFKTSFFVGITAIGFALTIVVLFLGAYKNIFSGDTWLKYLPMGLIVFVPFSIITLFGDGKEVSQGASKNLSGAFSSIAVMKYLKDLDISFDKTEICVLICGAHEYDCAGAKYFVAKQFKELEELPCVVINLDATAFDESQLGLIPAKDSEDAVSLLNEAADDADFKLENSKIAKKYVPDSSAFSKTYYSACALTSLPENINKTPDTHEDMKIKTIETSLKIVMSAVFIYDEKK